MAFKFPSAEWTEQFINEVNGNESYASAAKNWEGDISLVIDGGGAIYLDLWHGKCRSGQNILRIPTAASLQDQCHPRQLGQGAQGQARSRAKG